MKNVYLTIGCLAVAMLSHAQRAEKPSCEIQQYPGHDIDVLPASNGNRVVIWSEDFAGGWPAGWTIQDASGICPWKYTMGGSWGNFNGNGATAAGTPIASTTAANGFIINDPDSANHFTYGQPSGTTYQYLSTYFTTSAINTSGYNNVLLEFQHTFRFNNTINLEVHISNDGTNWTQYNVQGNATNNTASANPQNVSINISPIAGNQPTVYIKIGWNARVYYWMIDDMQIVEAPDDDLKMVNSNYYNTNLNSYGYAIKYTRVPSTQVAPLSFKGDIVNNGGNVQTNTNMSLDFRDATTSYYSATSTSVTLNPSDSNHALIASFTPAAVVRDYNIVYKADYLNYPTDATPANNVDTLSFMVTSSEYARDNNTYSTLGLWNGAGNPYVMGNTYQAINNFTINTVRVAFTANTDSLIIAYAEVYEIDQSTGDFILVTSSGGTAMEKLLRTNDISSGGTIRWTDLQIPATTLQAGGEYIVCVGHYGGPDDMTIMYGNKSEQQTTFLLDGTDNTWYYMTNTPMIRAAFSSVGIEEEMKSTFNLGNAVPNPADNITRIQYSLTENGNVSFALSDITGKIVYTETVGRKNTGEYSYEINVSGYAPGVYFYTLNVDGVKQTRKLIIK